MIRQVHMYCSLGVNINTRETPHAAQRSWMHFVYVCMVGKNPNTVNCSSTADNAIAQGGIGFLGSPIYSGNLHP